MILSLQLQDKDGKWATINQLSCNPDNKAQTLVELLDLRDKWRLSGNYLSDSFRVKVTKR